MATFCDAYGPVQPVTFRDFAWDALERGTPLPALVLDATRCLPFHPEVSGDQGEVEAYARLAQQVQRSQVKAAEAIGVRVDSVNDDRAVGEYVSGNPVDDVDSSFDVRFLYAFWRLCEQRLVTVETVPPSRAEQARAPQVDVDDHVRVVKLRQATAASKDGEAPGAVQWQHRWVVRMHKVRQWYPSEGRHKVIYRGPYVKGPADKPLRVDDGGDTVRVLLR